MRYFVYSQKIAQKTVVFNDEQTHHMRKVLRLALGDEVEVFDDKGNLYKVVVKKLSHDGSYGTIVNTIFADTNPKSKLTILQAFPSSLSKLDLVIEKCTELGADQFIFFKSKRSELMVTPSQDKINRWKKISIKSSEQSLRLSVPDIYVINSVEELDLDDFDSKILLYEKSENLMWPENLNKQKNCILAIGPEGGWEVNEVEKFNTASFIDIKPFQNILRTETAPIAATAIIKNLNFQ